MLHWLQVTIDLNKSNLYVKTKQKFQKTSILSLQK